MAAYIRYCKPHVCMYTPTKTDTPQTWPLGWGKGVLQLFIFPIPSLIGLWALENPVGIFKLGYRSDQSQNKQWLVENLQKKVLICTIPTVGHSPQRHSHGKHHCWCQIRFPPIGGALFLVIMWVLSTRQWHTRDTVQAGEMPLCFPKSFCSCAPGVLQKLYLHIFILVACMWNNEYAKLKPEAPSLFFFQSPSSVKSY